MGAVPLIAAGIGAGLQVYGQVKGASDRAEAAQAEAVLKNQQADELLSRELINEDVMRRQAGFEELHTTQLGQVLAIHGNLKEGLRNSRRDAEFKARMLRSGADIDTKLASDLVSSSYIGAGGTLLGLGTQVYDRFADYGGTAHLPKIGKSGVPTGQYGASSLDFSTGWWRQ